jgi:hypothetical protein
MTWTSPARRALAAAAVATATAGSLLISAAPASAAPVDGKVDAFGYGSVNVVGCATNLGPVNESRVFTPATGRRTAAVERSYAAEDAGGITARGRVENSSSGVADANAGAFNTVVFTAEHLVRINDVSAAECNFGVTADTQAGADLRVERRGRVHLEWRRGRAGQIEQIVVSRDGGNTIVDKVRPRRRGDLTFRVRPGSYRVTVQFKTRANEVDIPTGTTRTKRADFRVALDYRR